MVVRFYGMLLVPAKCPRSPDRREKLRTNEDLVNHLRHRLFHYRKESITRDLYRICLDRGGIWKGDILIADIDELENLGASEIYPRRLNAKEVLITQKDEEYVFPVTDGSARSSARDDEFQEPTLRRESTVRRQNLSGESQGGREELQLEEKNDEEVHQDFWSIQGDFIYRHHIEAKVQ